MSAIRDKAFKLLSAIPEPPAQINSSNDGGKTDNQKFTDLTNTPHSTMAANWKENGIMTACNGFVGWYGASLGSEKTFGRFDIEQRLKSYGKSHAWVKSTKDNRPKFGDVCRYTKFHIGVSLDFNGDCWNHADAGQGGKRTGYDILKRTYDTEAYDWKRLQGWIDLDLYFGDGKVESVDSTPTPNWLKKWWQISWRGSDFYYLFQNDGKVEWTKHAPTSSSSLAIGGGTPGKYAVDKAGGVIVSWSSGTVEKFKRTTSMDPSYEMMTGLFEESEEMYAWTMF